VAIPALDESATVAGVIASIRAAGDYDVLVVDDGSTDGTAAVAAGAGARVIVLPFNLGVGGAMRTAFVTAMREGYDRVVQVDADGQHDPVEIASLLEATSTCDIAIGARFAGAGDYDVHGPRRWAMQILARSLTRVTGTKLTDTTSGFRANSRRAIELFAQRYPAEYLGDTVESLVIASRAGLTVAQVPVSMRVRQGGAPSHGTMRATLNLGRAALALAVALSRRADAQAES
jgi:glycosyltransferase involved in cell wall biosynthesis